MLPQKIKPVFDSRLNLSEFKKDVEIIIPELKEMAKGGNQISSSLNVFIQRRRKRLKLQKHKPKSYFKEVDEVEVMITEAAEKGISPDFAKLNQAVKRCNYQRFAQFIKRISELRTSLEFKEY